VTRGGKRIMNLKLTFLAFLLGYIMPLSLGSAAELPSRMFNLNPEKIAERNSIVYRCLTPSPGEALLFGNGPMGGSVYTPDDSLNIQIGRSDIWNEKNNMGAIAAVRVRGNKGLFSRASAVRQECNLDEATLKISLQTKTGKVRLTMTCLRGKDLLVLRIEDQRSDKSDFLVSLENWHDGESVAPVGENGLETTHVNRTSVFTEVNQRVNLDGPALGVTDPLLGRAWGLDVKAPEGKVEGLNGLRLPSGNTHEVLISTACVAPQKRVDGEKEVSETCQKLVNVSPSELDEWNKTHLHYWKDFWSRSAISLHSGTGDAEYEERLWYVNLYVTAIGSGGAYPIRCFGGNFLLDHDNRDWDGGYWFQNTREVYWPLLASGHWDYMLDLFRMYFNSEKLVRAQTQNLYHIDGLRYPETQTFWGMDVGENLRTHVVNPVTHDYLSSNTEVCLLMDWYYQASGDEKFLRKEFYPFLKGILEFYHHYATRSEDGIYHLSPVSALETWLDMRDDMPNLCGLHYFLPKAIAWGEKFGEKPEVLDEWRDFLQHLAPLPVGRWTVSKKFMMGIPSEGLHTEDYITNSELNPDGIFLPAGGLLKDKSLRYNMENPELYVIFPWGLVGMDSPPKEARRAENTWNQRIWRYPDQGWSQDAVQVARMGWADLAKETLLAHAGYSQRFPNGCFIGPANQGFYGLLANVPFLDSAGAHLVALNEMLLQSYNGVIRIAPTVTPEWSGTFKLHALGGYVVEAEFVQGRPSVAQVTATRDGLVRVRNVSDAPMRIESAVYPKGEIFEKQMKKDETVAILWDGVPAKNDDVNERRPDVVWPGYKIRPPWKAKETGHWHDERNGNGQVGLAEDGLFPANRAPAPSNSTK